MAVISEEYINGLDAIYRDILSAFPQFDMTRKHGFGLSFPTLYSALEGKYTLAQIRIACENMANGGVLEIKNEIFAQPTDLGEELIAALTGREATSISVPPFSPPPSR